MKKMIICSLLMCIVLLVVFLPSCDHGAVSTQPNGSAGIETEQQQKITGENKLIVAGKEHHLPEKQMVFHERADHSSTVDLPFVTIMEALGAKVSQSSDNVTVMEWNGKKYLLDKERATLVAEGTNFNCIIPAPGSKVSHQIVDGVFLLDWVSIRTVTEMMGVSIKAEIDYQNHIVVIDKAS